MVSISPPSERSEFLPPANEVSVGGRKLPRCSICADSGHRNELLVIRPVSVDLSARVRFRLSDPEGVLVGATVAHLIPVDIEQLFDYSYWATRAILDATLQVPDEDFTAHPKISYRGLRGTMVHALDVERSWRLRIQGEPQSVYDAELSEDEFPNADALARTWAADEETMRSWLATTDLDALNASVDLGPKDRFPLSTFLLHIITHSTQQRRDAALILEHLGYTPPELDFLYYADFLADPET